VVDYGTSTSYGTLQTGTDGNTTSHTVTLTGLTPSTLYYFRVKSTDGNGNTSVNDNNGMGYTFTTAVAYNITATAGANGTVTPSGVTSVQSGLNQTYTITPNTGYALATLTVDGSTVTSATTYTFTNVTATHTIAATFTLLSFNVTASTGANGTVTPSGVTAVNYGANQTYTITPNSGYSVATLTVDGVSIAAATTYTFTNVTATHTIAATFTKSLDTIPPVITLNGVNPMSVTKNSTFTDPGATAFDTGDNASTSVTASGTVNTAALGTYTITYSSTDSSGNTAILTRTVNVVLSSTYNIVASTDTHGTISPSGTTSVTSGQNQTYTITPNTGYAVATLTVDSVSLAPVTTYTFTNVVAVHTIAVTFKDVAAPVITLLGTNPMSVIQGSTFTDPGATALDAVDGATTVTVTGTVNTSALGTYTLTYSSTDSSENTGTATRTVNVVLASSYNITATTDANGTITPSGTTTVTTNNNQTYTMTPNTGYSVATLTVDGVNIAPATTYTFTNVVATHTIAVTFTNVPFPQIGFNNSAEQGVESAGTANIPVSISTTYPTDIKVDYTVSGGTAVGSGVDYTLANGTLTIPAGQTTENISLAINDTHLYGPTKTVVVTLSNPINATLGTNTVNTYSIINDNIAVTNSGSNVKATSAIVTWTTATYTESLVEYGTIDPGFDPTNPTAGAYNLSKADSTQVLNHSIYLSGLTPSTEYFVRTTSTDSSNNTSVATSNFTTTAGPVISATTSSGVTDSVAVITWTTDIPASSYVNYSTDSGLANPTRLGTDTLVTTHSVTLTGLTASTTYYYSVDGTDTNSNVSEDTNGDSYYTFTTTVDTTPPVISGISTPVVTDTQAAIVWNTDKAATSQVMYGTTSCGSSNPCTYDNTSTLISTPLKNHLVALNNLSQTTQYYYVIVSTDAFGNTATSPEQTFTTNSTSVLYVATSGGSMGVAQDVYNALLAQNQAYEAKFGTDTSTPVISNIQVSAITPFGATISFSTSKDTIAFLDYGKDTTYGSSVDDHNWAQTHTITLDGLTLGTEYNFQINVLDKLDNLVSSDNQTFTTQFLAENLSDLQSITNVEQFQNEVDSTIASIIPSLVPPFIDTPTVTDVTENTATVNFSTNIKSYPVVDYTTDANYDATKVNPYDGEVTDVTTKTIDHSLVLKNLQPDTEYHVMAKAFSLAEVVGKSADFTFTTAASKIQASVVNVGTDSFTVVWTTNTGASSIVDYKDVKTGVTQRIDDETKNTSHSVNVQNLLPGTAYEVSVSGVDVKGNPIDSGVPVDITTLVDITPPVISNLKVDSSLIVGLANTVQTIISWQTDKPSTSTVYYEEGSGSPDAPLSNKQEDLELTLNHTVILTSLKAGTVYRFTVQSTDEAGNTIKPPIRTIVTPQITQSIMDIIFKNFDDTFNFINNVK
jgi:hypothetical protein